MIEEIPLPPANLRFRVAGTEDANWFERSGKQSMEDMRRALGATGLSFEDFDYVLDWGCGCGRILRHFERRDGLVIHGFDIDTEALAWVNRELPWVSTSSSEGLPPLPYGDAAFDLIFNHSVLTHLNAEYQDAWLQELKRVLKPGGTAILTVSGAHVFESAFGASPSRAAAAGKLATEGMIFIETEDWKNIFPNFYHNAFHDVSYVFEHWGRVLDVRCYIARGALGFQDMVVLQRPCKEAPSPGISLRRMVLRRDTEAFVSWSPRQKMKLAFRLIRESLGLRKKWS